MKVFRQRKWHTPIWVAAVLFVTMAFSFTDPAPTPPVSAPRELSSRPALVAEKMELYERLNLASLGLSHEAFVYGLTGFHNLLSTGKVMKDNILSIVDFSLPSSKKRLFVIDLEAGELLFHTYTSHGRNSGQILPTQFSNKANSNKSSLGFYITGDTYQGKHGESLRLLGEEDGINDNALKRGIVMHSATYVDEEIIRSQGFIGRSQGCPALPKNVYKQVIGTIKDGTCLFIYSPDKYYKTHSRMIRELA